jgi:hypothetical protein
MMQQFMSHIVLTKKINLYQIKLIVLKRKRERETKG